MIRIIKRYLIAYIAITALTIATPQFDARAQAEDTGGFFFVLEGRGALSEGDSTVWLEEIVAMPFGPTGRIADIDTDHARYSGRAGGGYRSGAWDFGIFYSGLQALDDEESFVPPSFFFGGALVIGPIPAYGDGGDLYNASSSVTYTVADFEAGFNFKLGSVDAQLFGGARFASMDQDVNTSIDRGGAVGLEHRDVDFWGAGLRLGASASVPISGPFGVTASISGAGLFGQQDSITTTRGTIGDARVGNSDFRVAGNFDGGLGVTFNHQMDNASTMIITLGYRAEAWLDVNDTQSQPLTISGIIHGSTRADQIFHGPFLRGEWRFK